MTIKQIISASKDSIALRNSKRKAKQDNINCMLFFYITLCITTLQFIILHILLYKNNVNLGNFDKYGWIWVVLAISYTLFCFYIFEMLTLSITPKSWLQDIKDGIEESVNSFILVVILNTYNLIAFSIVLIIVYIVK